MILQDKILTYQGTLHSCYLFTDDYSKLITFSKCRRELITQFKLEENETINKQFRVKFFQTAIDKVSFEQPQLIISEIKPI